MWMNFLEVTQLKVKFTVLGEPTGKGRPRFRSAGNLVQTYTPDKTVSYENLIKTEYRRQCHDFKFENTDQLDVRITAYYGIPKSKPKKTQKLMEEHILRPLKKPDADNVIKAVLDSLNNIAYHDDTQVVDLQIRRFYSRDPRLVVTIQEAKVLPIHG